MNSKRVLFIVLPFVGGMLLMGLLVAVIKPAFATEPAQAISSSEGVPVESDSEVYIPDKYRHTSQSQTNATTKTLYYFPLDSNNHNTLLFFHNTLAVTSTIDLQFQSDSGTACLSGVVFDIPPGGSARVSADSLDAGRPFSWSDTIIYNMFDTCEIGLITMPSPGVQVEGYVAWTANDTYNPRELNPHAEIRFSTDPYTIHMPMALNR